jgi:uncharacterized protein YecT (DUF1311 family)
MKEIIVYIAGLLTSALAYLVQRKIERRGEHDEVDLIAKLLGINREMKNQNVTADELKELKQTLIGRTEDRGIPTRGEIALLESIEDQAPDRIITQAGLNQTSFQGFEKSDLELRHVLERLEPLFSASDIERLEQAQNAWRRYRDKQIAFAGGLFEGGSMRPLIHNLEAQSLTDMRVRELRRVYDDLQRR